MIVRYCHKTNNQCRILSVTTPGIVSQELLRWWWICFSFKTCFSKPHINSSENSGPSKNWWKNWTRLIDLFNVETEMELSNHLAQWFPSASPWSPAPSDVQRGDGRWVWELWSLSFYLLYTLEFCIRFNWGKGVLLHISKSLKTVCLV